MAVPFGDIAVSSQTLDHLGLVAGMYDELGIGEVLDGAIAQDPLQRLVVFANHRFVPTYRRDEVPPRPKVLPDKIALSLAVNAGEVDSTFTFDVLDHLRDCIRRRNRDQHVHMIRHQMSLFNAALLLLSQLMEHFS